MVETRVLGLLPYLPDGVSEFYFHPAAERSASIAAAMPAYRATEELAALVSPALRRRIAELEIELVSYGDLAGAS